LLAAAAADAAAISEEALSMSDSILAAKSDVSLPAEIPTNGHRDAQITGI